MGQYQYDFNKVCLNIGGVQVSGYFKGTSIDASQDGANIEFDQGLDGQVCMIIHSFKKLGSVKFTLNQGALANKLLLGVFQTQVSSGLPVPLLMTNVLGGETVAVGQGALTKSPDISFSDQNSGRQWEFMGQIDLVPLGAIPS